MHHSDRDKRESGKPQDDGSQLDEQCLTWEPPKHPDAMRQGSVRGLHRGSMAWGRKAVAQPGVPQTTLPYFLPKELGPEAPFRLQKALRASRDPFAIERAL